MKFFLVFCSFCSVLISHTFNYNDFDELKDINVQDYYVSEYIDGMGARWDGERLFNNDNQTYEINKDYTKDFPPFDIKGALFCGTDYYDTFNDVALNKLKCTKFYVADVPYQKGDLMDRLKVLKEWLQKHPNNNITFIKQHEFSDNDEFIDYFNYVVLKGSEGVYMHKKNTAYDVPSKEKIIRVKRFYKDNCVISKINLDSDNKLINYECKWKKANALRALEDDNLSIDNKELTTITIGSGFTIDEINHPFEVGTKIGFKYYKLDKENKPMHSVFIRRF